MEDFDICSILIKLFSRDDRYVSWLAVGALMQIARHSKFAPLVAPSIRPVIELLQGIVKADDTLGSAQLVAVSSDLFANFLSHFLRRHPEFDGLANEIATEGRQAIEALCRKVRLPDVHSQQNFGEIWTTFCFFVC